MSKPKTPRVYLIRMYLVTRRFELGYSQYKVAQLCNYELPTYNQIENGKLGHLMNAYHLKNIATVLGFSIEEMVELESNYLIEFYKANNIVPYYMN